MPIRENGKIKPDRLTILLDTASDSRSFSISDGSIGAERAITIRVLAITATAIVNAMIRFVDILPIELQIKNSNKNE